MMGTVPGGGVRRRSSRGFGSRSALVVIAALVIAESAGGCERRDARGNPVTVGRLRLRTFPSGAKVWIDGQLKIESTPATLVLEQGTYHLEIQLEGAEPLEKTIEIEGGDYREMDLNLPRPPDATISVLSDVEGAQIRINGWVRGTTPLLKAVTRPGPIDMTVVTPDGRAKSVRTNLAIAEQKVIQVMYDQASSEPPEAKPKKESPPMSLPPPRGYLTLGLKPDGEVFDEEGRSLGRTPIQSKPIDPGEHELTLRSIDGRFEKRVTVEIEVDKTAVYRFRFTDSDSIR